MEELIAKIKSKCEFFDAEATKGSKAAAQRARKLSLEVEKLLKQYRKESIKG